MSTPARNTDTAIIIPVYNEGRVIDDVLQELSQHFQHIVCVNDGSSDDSAARIARHPVTLVSHAVNLGQGGALQTGIECALLEPEVQYFVTFDSDGQHRVEDALKMLEKLRTGEHDIVLGSRFLQAGTQPGFSRSAVLKLAVWFTNVTTGLRLTDAHNGLRVFNRDVASKLDLHMNDMAHASEILNRIKQHRFRYTEEPVFIDYTEYSKAKGQSSLNAVNIVFDLLLQRVGKDK